MLQLNQKFMFLALAIAGFVTSITVHTTPEQAHQPETLEASNGVEILISADPDMDSPPSQSGKRPK